MSSLNIHLIIKVVLILVAYRWPANIRLMHRRSNRNRHRRHLRHHRHCSEVRISIQSLRTRVIVEGSRQLRSIDGPCNRCELMREERTVQNWL